MSRRAPWALALCLTAEPGLAAAAAIAAGLGGSVGVSTDHVHRGISQSRGEAAVQADLHFATQRWTVGIWASNVEFRPRRRSSEFDLYAEWRWPLKADFTAQAGAVYYTFPDDPRTVPYDYVELNTRLAWRDAVALALSWSPSTPLFLPRQFAVADRQTWSAELNVARPLAPQWSVHAGVGYFTALQVVGAGHTYGSAGLAWNKGPLRADLSYFWSRDAETGAYAAGLPAARPWAASLSWRF